MTTSYLSKVRVIRAVFGALFGLFASGCETNFETPPTDTATAATVPATTNPAITNTPGAVLNDDPNCELVIKYQNRNVNNDGQVHYVNRVLISDPYRSANPICVQYNDTRAGEVTVWKDTSSKGQRVDVLPRDRGIDKIVVWYQ